MWRAARRGSVLLCLLLAAGHAQADELQALAAGCLAQLPAASPAPEPPPVRPPPGRKSGLACYAAPAEPEPELIGPGCADFLQAYRVHAEWGAAGALTPHTREGLQDLLALLQDQQPRRVLAPSPDAVAAILRAIRTPPPPADASGWQRFLRWLRERLEREQDQGAGALAEWLRQLPEELVQAVWWCLFTILAGMLALIVAAELRAAGAFRRGAAARGSAPGAAPAAQITEAAALDLEQIAQLPTRAQPAALLRYAIAALARRGLLPADRSLTNRELQAQLPPATVEATWFGQVVALADACIYGGRTPAPEAVPPLLGAAAQLQPTRE